MKELVFIQSCPLDNFWIWQVKIWLNSLRELDKSKDAVSLIFVPKGREKEIENWNEIISLYPEAKFVFYKDEDNITAILPFYIPIIRPYCLKRYFKENPELINKAIFYCDCDIIFTSNFNISSFIDDNTCYLSNTFSYISATYFDSKFKDVLSEKLEKYKEIDVLNEACEIVGINREIAVKNDLNSGGAQYLLKNIDYTFWERVFSHCLRIRMYLQKVNREYFENESKGFQSWCCDMWAVLWELWYREQETKVIPEMEFAWSSDDIEKLSRPNVGILHNAGITGDFMPEIKDTKGKIIRPSFPTFYKGKYHTGLNPLDDPHIYKVYNNEHSKKICNWYYLIKLLETK